MTPHGPMAEYVYITNWTDEVLPCLPNLEAWAEWLSKPDEEWSRTEAAKDGEEFEAYSLVVLCDVRVDRIDGKLVATPEPPVEATEFFLRHSEGSSGWDPEYAGNTIDDAIDGGIGLQEDDDGPFFLACTKAGDVQRVRYLADPPRCEIVEAQA